MGTPKRASPVQDWEKNYKVKLIVKEEWDEQRDIFTRLYITEGRKLADVRRIMAEQHGFYANPKQCKLAIKKWKLEKNLNKEKVTAILRIRKERALEGKDTDFTLHGQPINIRLLERCRKRYRVAEHEGPGSPVATPPGVGYSTPKSPSSPGSGSREGTLDSWDLPRLSSVGNDSNGLMVSTDTDSMTGLAQQIHQAAYTATEVDGLSYFHTEDDDLPILTMEELDNLLAGLFET